MAKPNIILYGAPGSGKGTELAYLLKDNYTKISVGDMLRNEVRSGSDLGKKLKAIMDKGDLIDDKFVMKLIKKEIKTLDKKEGLVFDGFPRTLKQAKYLDKLFSELDMKIDYFIEIFTAEKIIINRIMNRIECRKCGASYNKVSNKPKKDNTCDACGSDELHSRDDDNLDTLKNRLEKYYENSKKIIKHYKKHKKYHKIKTKPNKKEVINPDKTHQEVMNVLSRD